MSHAAMSFAMTASLGSHSRFMTLLCYANHANHADAMAWPSLATVAEYVAQGRPRKVKPGNETRNVSRNVAALIEAGYLREGDQALYPYRERNRPIVYQVATSEAQRAAWAAAVGQEQTRRDAFVRAGSIGQSRRNDLTKKSGRQDEVTKKSGRHAPRPDKNVTPQRPDKKVRSSDAETATLDGPRPDILERDDLTKKSGKPTTEPKATTEQHHNQPRTELDLRTGKDSVELLRNSSSPMEDDHPGDIVRPDVEDLCKHLADRIEGNGSNRPTITKQWRDSARLLLDKDGRTADQVRRAIDWCQDDDFWRGNVLSMPTLRKQYERLRLQAQRAGVKPASGQTLRARGSAEAAIDHVWER